MPYVTAFSGRRTYILCPPISYSSDKVAHCWPRFVHPGFLMYFLYAFIIFTIPLNNCQVPCPRFFPNGPGDLFPLVRISGKSGPPFPIRICLGILSRIWFCYGLLWFCYRIYSKHCGLATVCKPFKKLVFLGFWHPKSLHFRQVS